LKIENFKSDVVYFFELNSSFLDVLDWRNISCNGRLIKEEKPLVLVSADFYEHSSKQFKSCFTNFEVWNVSL
jgi:hypothetical protein